MIYFLDKYVKLLPFIDIKVSAKYLKKLAFIMNIIDDTNDLI